jgi:hypothetical protein
MKECEGVQQLERRTRIDDSCVSCSTSSANKTPKGKYGTQTLSATHNHAREFGKGSGEIGVETNPTGLFLGE